MKEIVLITPIADMPGNARRVIAENDYDNIDILEGNLDTGLEEAEAAIAAGAKVIISRGGTYELIQSRLPVPVIEVKVTAFDLIESLKRAKQSGETGVIGVIGYGNVIFGAEIIAELMDLQIDCYRLSKRGEAPAEIDRMVQQGIRTFVGDANIEDAARRYGARVFVIESGFEAMQIAMQNAHAALLELRVEERTRELSEANQSLTQTIESLTQAQSMLVEMEKVASLGRLVAGVAHELSTPLGNALVLLSGDDELEKEIAAAVASGQIGKRQFLAYMERARESRKIASRSLMRASEIIQGFKQLAVDQTSEMRRPFDLATVIDEVLGSVRPRFRHTLLRIEAELEPGIEMDSYPGPLGQVITNIAMNALTHAFPDNQAGTFKVVARRLDADTISLVCSDDGVGMSEDVLHKLYDPFFSTKLGQGGSGLGMHIVYTIVTGLLNGQIEVHSQPGQGARFSIVMPRITPAKRPLP